MTGVGQYVELLKEKTLKLHEKVLDTKKILIDNKIDVDRHFQECKELLSLMTEMDKGYENRTRLQFCNDKPISSGKIAFQLIEVILRFWESQI